MAHVQVRQGNGEWHEVRGTALKLSGIGRYRIIVTDDLESFCDVAIEEIELRVNGLPARDLVWVLPPAATIDRGYVSLEASMG